LLENQSFNSSREPLQQNFEKEELYLQQIAELEQQVFQYQTQLDSRQSLIPEQPTHQHITELEQQVLQLQQLQPNWERQISEIIDWVGNEKEARNYLQQMAATMTKELEKLQQQQQQHNLLLQRYSPPVQQFFTPSKQQQSWQERRSARVDKQELLQLQLELQNEIEDKQRIQVELTRVQRELNVVMSELNETRNEMQKIQEQQTKRQSLPPSSAPNILFSHESRSPVDYQNQSQTQLQSPEAIESDVESTTDTSSLSEAQRFTISSQQQKHSFIIRTFVAPLKCNHCTSLMIGLIRQGLVCEGLPFLDLETKYINIFHK
jgi:serine/threonine-protein kinase MRCK